jgi:general secretion pathway protein H
VKHRANAGFTLIELLMVVALIAVASSVASLALRDPAATRLEREAARLVALLEAARSEARASGLFVSWAPLTPRETTDRTEASPDFRFAGLPPSSNLPSRWLGPDLAADVVGARAIVLGPEPLIGAQRIVLRLDGQRIMLQTDGLGPFTVVDSDTLER